MGFKFMQKSITLNDLERRKRMRIQLNGNQKLLCYGRNVRIMLALLTYLYTVGPIHDERTSKRYIYESINVR